MKMVIASSIVAKRMTRALALFLVILKSGAGGCHSYPGAMRDQ